MDLGFPQCCEPRGENVVKHAVHGASKPGLASPRTEETMEERIHAAVALGHLANDNLENQAHGIQQFFAASFPAVVRFGRRRLANKPIFFDHKLRCNLGAPSQ